MIDVRKAKLGDEGGIAQVHVDSWRTTYNGIINDKILNNLSVERRETHWRNAIEKNELLYVAINEEGRIIGFSSAGKSRSSEYQYDGELYAIYILEDYQKRGIGKQLISSVAKELREDGYQSIIVWVLSENPSKTAYEKLGASPFDSKEIEIGGEMYKEEVLVWKDIKKVWG
jgi:L-amino acid N-acyltransferase YncA